jgi:geranylgeranyl diphosphate synthase type II
MPGLRDKSEVFDEILPAIEETLEGLLPGPDSGAPPGRLHEAMRYSVFAGGKRLRPALCVAGYRTFHSVWAPILRVAAAVELVHTYSLIHDDLPSMDDDDFRRGIPSCHRKYGEAIAVLAGDGLLTLAFETMARLEAFPAEKVLHAISMLGRAAGASEGMIAGQVLDLDAAGRGVDAEALERIHRRKTGALLKTSVCIGAYLAGASPDELAAVEAYGRDIGLAFQVVDDILDETAPGARLGKTPGKDRRQEKATYPGLYGIASSRRIVGEVTASARESILPLGERGRLLADIADYLEGRSH